MDMLNEVWIPIKGYEGKYEVSNFGNIKSLNYNGGKSERMMKPQLNKDKYFSIRLSNNDGGRSFLVHRIVAEAFLDNPNNYPQINHIDGNKTNNVMGNLEWCTGSQNVIHAYANGLTRATPKQIRVKVVETGKIYDSIKQCGEELNVWRQNISHVLNKKSKTAGGYHFVSAEVQE